jgi:glucosamine kinase
MILIADSGSTKTSWCLIQHGKVLLCFETEGFNPYFTSTAYIIHSLEEVLPISIERKEVQKIFFYGSGCFPDKAIVISNALRELFSSASVNVELDLLGTARALLGNSSGFAAILGTGTNSCLYDGQQITMNIDSLGYILGDEGSGTHIGKRLLADYLHGYMPAPEAACFAEIYNTNKEEVFNRVYAQPLPNRYCASFVPFLRAQGVSLAYREQVLTFCFSEFFDKLVTHYPLFHNHTFNCTGSVAYHFRDELSTVASKYGMRTGLILKEPMEGLVNYHRDNAS